MSEDTKRLRQAVRNQKLRLKHARLRLKAQKIAEKLGGSREEKSED